MVNPLPDDVVDNINQRRLAEIVGILDSETHEPCSTDMCPGARGFRCGNCGNLEMVCPCGCSSQPCCENSDIPHSACIYFHYGRPGDIECIHTCMEQ